MSEAAVSYAGKIAISLTGVRMAIARNLCAGGGGGGGKPEARR